MRTTIHSLIALAIVSACGSIAPSSSAAPTGASSTAIASSTTPAASAGSPAFSIPQDCRIVSSNRVDQIDEWLIDCGSSRNQSARATMDPTLTQQGWVSCGSGLASASWAKGATMIGVSEPADVTVGFRVRQGPKVSPCN
jgi:hypothetical protein